MSINPIAASAAIEESYKNYLATTFRFGDVNLQQQFIEQLSKSERLLKDLSLKLLLILNLVIP